MRNQNDKQAQYQVLSYNQQVHFGYEILMIDRKWPNLTLNLASFLIDSQIEVNPMLSA